jgi:uncharacterized SAM-binding protein YcdF (DUF218 family)
MRALLLVAALLSGGCYGLNRSITGELVARQGRVPACDAILVPGCPAHPDGTASTCIERRVRAGVAAFHEGLAPRLVFSGGAAHNGVVEARAMADFARELGVPDGAMLIEPYARHTTENIRNTAYLLEPFGWRRVLIVTDALQLPFAFVLAQQAGLVPYARLAHPDLPAREIRRRLQLDRWEPVPRHWWF